MLQGIDILVIPVFQRLESTIIREVSAHILIRYGINLPVTLEQPKQTSFGELALPVAFQLAKELKTNPRAIAAELVAELPQIDGVASFEVAGGGYINLRFNRGWYGLAALSGVGKVEPKPGKIIVEHTNINPNKSAHIGHLRNAILGDTFVRMLRQRGNQVEVQNYIDNTGVQVADVVVGFHFLEQQSPAQVKALAAADRFDYLCWDLYARTSAYYQDHKEALQWRAETLHSIEAGTGELAEMGTIVADAIVACHLRTMLRLDIVYDVLPRESEILHLKFWAQAFELLKERKAIEFCEEGKNKGCWVMKAAEFTATDDENMDKVIVRSNGTVTYVGKDIAYQMWKFGLLGKDFYYKLWHTYPNGKKLFSSSAVPAENQGTRFGAASEVYNVIDARQSYLQDVVVAGLRALGFHNQADKSIHFSYEMVALSQRTCVDLGIQLSSEDKERPYVEVSGRKGLGVKADDLIDKLIEAAKREVDSRHAQSSEADRLRAATAIAIGALRYFMLKYTRNSVIAFDFQEALSFTGETGPYLLYATVRIRKLLQKLEGGLPDFKSKLNPEIFARQLADEKLWQHTLAATLGDTAVERALNAGEPAHMARYAFQLAQSYNLFYHDFPVLDEQDEEKRIFLLWLTDLFRGQLERALHILGIAMPEFM